MVPTRDLRIKTVSPQISATSVWTCYCKYYSGKSNPGFFESAQLYALDDLCDSVRVVGARNGYLLYDGRCHSHPIGARVGGLGVPDHSGTQVHCLNGTLQGQLDWPMKC
jgi:hypothetical protein